MQMRMRLANGVPSSPLGKTCSISSSSQWSAPTTLVLWICCTPAGPGGAGASLHPGPSVSTAFCGSARVSWQIDL